MFNKQTTKTETTYYACIKKCNCGNANSHINKECSNPKIIQLGNLKTAWIRHPFFYIKNLFKDFLSYSK